MAITGCDAGGREVIVIPPPDDGAPVYGPTETDLASAPAIELEEQLRIDGDASETAFSYIRGIAVSATGEIFVLESQANSVFVFDASGNLSRRIGGAGDGPGEMRSPAHMALAGDTLLVIDRRGINRFTVDGAFLDRTAVQSGGSERAGSYTLFPQSLASTAAGLYTSFPAHPGRRESPYSDSTSIHKLDAATGAVSEPVAYVVSDHRYKLTSGSEALPLYMSARRHAVMPDGRILMTRQDGEHIDILSADGSLEGRLRIPARRRRVSNADADAVAVRWAESSRDYGEGFDADGFARALETHPRAEYVPVIGRFIAGDGGEILLERLDLHPGEFPPINVPSTWDLLGADGAVVGRMEFPARFTPRVLRDGQVLGVQMDDADVPSVIRYRMVAPQR